MDEYSAVLAKLLRLVFARWLERIEQKLQLFAEALDEWLHELFANPTIDWRDRFEQFLAEQEAAGYIVPPDSRQELIAYLENWAASIGLQETVAGSQAVDEREQATPVGGRSATRVSSQRLNSDEAFFFDKLARAQRQLDEMRRILEALGRRLDAAAVDEQVDVDSDVEAIEALIWGYNDAIESAQDAWLRGDLPDDALRRLNEMLTPASLGLPLFADEQQLQRRVRQGMQIHHESLSRDAAMDRLVFGLQVTEFGTGAVGILAAGGALVYVAKKGGKWAVAKTLAVVAAAAAAEQAAEHGLRAAGANETTIRGVRLAAVIVSYIILRRRIARSTADPDLLAPRTGPTTQPSGLEPRGPLKNRGGDLEHAARAARTQRHGPDRAGRSRMGDPDATIELHPEGSFSIHDWSGDPQDLAKPRGPFRVLTGEQFKAAREAASKANRAMRRADPDAFAGKEIHEIHPVKLGGSPTDPSNKVALPADFHRRMVTPWWNRRLRDLRRKGE